MTYPPVINDLSTYYWVHNYVPVIDDVLSLIKSWYRESTNNNEEILELQVCVLSANTEERVVSSLQKWKINKESKGVITLESKSILLNKNIRQKCMSKGNIDDTRLR